MKKLLFLAVFLVLPHTANAQFLLVGTDNLYVSLPMTLTSVKPTGTVFNRASIGTYLDASGCVSTQTVGNPRFTHDASNNPIGMLIEATATNLAYPSTPDAGTTWAYSNATGSINAAASPSCASDATLITETTSTSNHFLTPTNAKPSYVSGTTYAFSVYAKKGTATVLQLFAGSSAFGVNAWVDYNLNTGALGSAGSSVVAKSITDVGNGWYRCEFTAAATASVSNSAAVGIAFTNNNASATRLPSYTGTSMTAYVWGAQNEFTKTTALISTTSAPVARSPDLFSFVIPTGITTLTYTFDDNSTQNESVTANTNHTVPQNLNRAPIKTISGS